MSCKEANKKTAGEINWPVSEIDKFLANRGIDLCSFYDSLYIIEQPIKNTFSKTGISFDDYKDKLRNEYSKIKASKNLTDSTLQLIAKYGIMCPGKEEKLLAYYSHEIWKPISEDEIFKQKVKNYLKDRGLDLCGFYSEMVHSEEVCIKEADLIYPDFGIKHNDYAEKCMKDKRKAVGKKYHIADSMFTKIFVVGLKACN